MLPRALEPLTRAQVEREKKLKEIEKQFSNAIKQWDTMPEKSKFYYIAKAKQHVDEIPIAEMILTLANDNEGELTKDE